ncbi:glycosyltransferase family 2 protein [Phenylobacterium sp.]|jgi:glycosyltransferase involved in cell wall biosynthesis|uniref:glycosyltransferase family 2 protein n=1 Tax=Phenylobacterium sp. TaxID=1871053 RepID=UPI002F415EC7
MTANREPRLAVIMTCYNEGAFIGAAVRSVLRQTCGEAVDQIVIADDGSLPDTIAALKDIETWDSRIRVIYGPGGAGLPAQRNRAIAQTTAPFFAILDGDDLWTEDKVERQLPVMLSSDAIGLVYSDYFAFSDDDLSGARRAGVIDLAKFRDQTLGYFLNDPPIIPSTTLIRRSVFDACGGFDQTIRVFEDTDFYLRASRFGAFRLVDSPLLYKRFRPTSITGGRKDLLGHHALVAFKAAAEDPRLLRLVPRRLSERARKLGAHSFLLGDTDGAVRLLRLAVQLAPFNLRTWAFLIAAAFFGKTSDRLIARFLEARRAALGRVKS